MSKRRNATAAVLLGMMIGLVLAFRPAPVGVPAVSPRWVNTAHLNHLYRSVRLPNGVEVGTIAIYSNAPTYELIGDEDEGFTCIDDVARAALFLLREPDLGTDAEKRDQLRKLTELVLQMQAENGYYYNFLWPDRTINRTFRTSVAQPNWWSWRAFWLLSEAYPYFRKTNSGMARRIQTANRRLVTAMLRDFGNKPQDTTLVQGISVPQWLPYGSGTDQAAIMLLGLANYYRQTPDASVRKLMDALGDGILRMQQGDADHFPYGVILSFENNWHAYGGDQSYALQNVGKALNKPDWIRAARLEIDHFYPYLLKQGWMESMAFRREGSEIVALTSSPFSQIAYGVRPYVWAALEAYDQTGEQRYAELAAQLTRWFLGANVASVPMYDRATGRCFDGILSPTKINKNSGAESTIEALWALQQIEKYPAALKLLNK